MYNKFILNSKNITGVACVIASLTLMACGLTNDSTEAIFSA